MNPPIERAPRRLVVCCDGTNNTLTGGVEDTNVLLLYRHLRQHGLPDTDLYYDPGVGSPEAIPPTNPVEWFRRSWDRLSGLASGQGVYDNVAEAYLFLMRHWRDPQDEIYLFGFSRGAFTARAVAGMVNLFGVVRPQHEVLLPSLVRIYFSLPGESQVGHERLLRRFTRWLHRVSARPASAGTEAAGHNEAGVERVTRERLAAQVRAEFASPAGAQAAVHFVGVFDTVESVGLPGPLSRTNPATATLAGKRMRHVRHALAFDERRWTFEPRLYEEPGDLAGPQTLKQRWFRGGHCDVGGSYTVAQAGLSTDALDWMIEELSAFLPIGPAPRPGDAVRVRHDALWNTPWWALAGMSLRTMTPRTADGVPIAVIPHAPQAPVNGSVWDRPRPAWPLALAGGVMVAAHAFASATLAGGLATLAQPMDRWAYFAAPTRLAAAQFTVWDGRLAQAIAAAPGPLVWAMAWDAVFLVAWGYLLARVTSRAFSALAGWRSPQARQPGWRWLGFAPLAAVGGDVVENLMTVAAVAAQGLGTHVVASALLVLGAAGALAKVMGLAASVPLVVVRLWLAVRPARCTPEVLAQG